LTGDAAKLIEYINDDRFAFAVVGPNGEADLFLLSPIAASASSGDVVVELFLIVQAEARRTRTTWHAMCISILIRAPVSTSSSS